jgi:hypothetical protein
MKNIRDLPALTWRALCWLINWFTNPLTNEESTALSLGRMLLAAFCGAMIYGLLYHLGVMTTMQAPAAALLAIMFFVLAVYCFCTKDAMQEILLTLARGATAALASKLGMAAPTTDASVQAVDAPGVQALSEQKNLPTAAASGDGPAENQQ